MILPQRAQRIILASSPKPKTKKILLHAARQETLAKNVVASSDYPAFDRATMDGFAVRYRDASVFSAGLRCVADLPAGRVSRRRLQQGECVRIATGAMLPEGADSVVAKEDAMLSGSRRIKPLGKVVRGQNVGRRAQDFRRGEVLLKKGTTLSAARLGLLASQGLGGFLVYARPSVALLATGDELIEPGRSRGRSSVWNASASMLVFALERLGVTVSYLGIARDEPAYLSKKIKEGLKSDILIITGAVSAGERDYVPRCLKNSGVRVVFHKVALRPGKPFLFGVKGRHRVFGLPGNPVSSLVSFLFFVRPLIMKMSGQTERRTLCEGILTKGVYNKSERLTLYPACVEEKDGRIFIKPLRYSGSADIRAVAHAAGFFSVAKKTVKHKGETAPFFPLTL